jgi:OmcA/MtrC family decaheme c-type cytochrome
MRTTSLIALLVGAGALALSCKDAEPPDETTPATDAGPDAAPPTEAGDDAQDASPVRPTVVTGPGLHLAVTGTSIDASGLVTVTFTITDGAGVPLDLNGTYTEAAVSANFVLSRLDSAYTALTTQEHAGADGGAPTALPDADTGGAFVEVGVGQGTYAYTFGARVPSVAPSANLAVGVWAYRDYRGARFVANAVVPFTPAGSPPTATRDIVTTTACNQCHAPLGLHEGSTARRDVKLCVLCHTPQAVDPTNGRSLAMPAMIHGIHRGRALPSVAQGGMIAFTDDDGGLDDHSRTWFPGSLQTCPTCHQGSQGAVWKTEVTRALCATCHDRTSFVAPPPAGFTMHGGGARSDDSLCASCHVPQGTPLAVADAHRTPSTDPNAPQLALSIDSVTNAAPGQTPTVHFSVTKNGLPLDLLAVPLTGLAITVGGPTSDYADAVPAHYVLQGDGATGTVTLDGAVGHYTYALPAPIAAGATGTFAFGMEGWLQPDPSTPTRYAALNPVAYVPITDPAPVPRRTVVDRAKCNACHGDLAAHGGTRKSVEYCVMCHAPNAVDDANAPRFEVPSTAPPIHFKVLVHKIHRGDRLTQGYVVGGDPGPTPSNPAGTPVDFGTVGYPGNLRACWACHASTSYFLPLPPGLLPTKTGETLACTDPTLDAGAYCAAPAAQSATYLAPASAACTACHDAPSSLTHAQSYVAPDGTESCASCHGNGAPWDVQAVHVLPP